MKMKKRSVSIIEVLIALGLLSLLLSTLFFWYRSFSKQKVEFTILKAPLMEERYTHQRLQSIFGAAALPLFTASAHTLVFYFDRGPSPEPKLAGEILGSLYYDASERCLCLGIWPKPTSENSLTTPSETFVLLEGVEGCTFSFYHPPDHFKKPVDPEEIGKPKPKEGWQNSWEASYKMLPALMKIEIDRLPGKGFEKHKIRYLFDLPVTIVYPEEKI